MEILMMRTLLLSLVLVPAIGGFAQQPTSTALPAGSNWQHVQALPVGASVQVKARKSHANCYVKSVDADTLTCAGKKDIVFARTDVVSIRIPRRGRSTLIGLGIGAGVGAGVGAAASGCSTAEKNSFLGCFLTPTRPQGAAIGGVLFGGILAAIGAATDFARSTVYEAP
jgi:hypothetical protein